jgi:hypothetical protein
MTTGPTQLLVYEFPPGSSFEGQLVGALERIESGGAMRIRDGLFVGREDDSGDLIAISMTARGSGGMVTQLISVRLEGASARRSATERVLEGPNGSFVRSLAATLQPGEALVAVLVEHTWAQMLTDTIGRMGGVQLASEFVDASEIDAGWSQLPAEIAARRSD